MQYGPIMNNGIRPLGDAAFRYRTILRVVAMSHFYFGFRHTILTRKATNVLALWVRGDYVYESYL